jgi:O-antigen ligase
MQNDTIKQSINRTGNNELSMEQRIDIWESILRSDSFLKYIFSGVGPSIVIDGYPRKPHNGLIYLIYSYGAIASFMFLYLFFNKRKSVSWRNYIYMISNLDWIST